MQTDSLDNNHQRAEIEALRDHSKRLEHEIKQLKTVVREQANVLNRYISSQPKEVPSVVYHAPESLW